MTLVDNYGYESSGTTLSFVIDITAPLLPTIEPLQNISATGSVYLS